MSPTDTFITIGGLRLHLRDWGGPDVPPAILLVHGLASNARIWDLLAPLLAPNFRLVAIDQRGHGVSDKPDDGYDLATIAGDLAGAIVALGWSRPLVRTADSLAIRRAGIVRPARRRDLAESAAMGGWIPCWYLGLELRRTHDASRYV